MALVYEPVSVNMPAVWLVLMIILLVIEGVVPGLVSIWFAIGALGGMATAALGGDLWVQIAVFLALSALSLLLFKPLSKKMFLNKVSRTNADRVLGENALVTETVDNALAKGQVRVDGQIWSARSAHDVVIPEGTEVRVLRIEGVKVIVETKT